MSHDAEPTSEETPWDCVSLEKNANSVLRPNVKPPESETTEPTDETNGRLTFFKVAEIVFILFFIGILAGAVLFVMKRSVFERSPDRRRRSTFFSVRYAKKSIIDEMVY